MNKVVILTDSTCDLSNEIITNLDIKVLPLYVSFKSTGETFKDLVDLDCNRLYHKIERHDNELPTTSAASVGDYELFFKQFIDKGYDIFYTGIGSTLSSCFHTAQLAAESFPEDRIYFTDSKNLSTGSSLLLIKACRYRDEGLSAKEIKEKCDRFVPRIKTQFVIKSLDYMHKGGRCSNFVKIFGTLLRIKPILMVRDGILKVGKKPIGLMKKGVNEMLKIFYKDLPNIDTECVFITHSALSDASYEQIDESFKENNVYDKIKNVYHTEAGCVIGSHCGPGTIGILYIVEDRDVHDDDLEEE